MCIPTVTTNLICSTSLQNTQPSHSLTAREVLIRFFHSQPSSNMTHISTLLFLLTFYTTSTFAGQCLSICPDPQDCPEGPPNPGEPLPLWQSCPNGPAPGAQWACQDPSLDFPTVDCLAADMRTCGLVGQGGRSTVFYSFGSTTSLTRPVRDSLNPRGVMWNEAGKTSPTHFLFVQAEREHADLEKYNSGPGLSGLGSPT